MSSTSSPCPTFGYLVVIDTVPGLHAREVDLPRSAWLQFLDARGLYCGGGAGAERLEYVIASEAAQATEGDREATRAWLDARPELRGWRVDDLEDLDRAV